MALRKGKDNVKRFFFFFFIRKPYVKELNGSQEIEEHQKSEKHTKICKR